MRIERLKRADTCCQSYSYFQLAVSSPKFHGFNGIPTNRPSRANYTAFNTDSVPTAAAIVGLLL